MNTLRTNLGPLFPLIGIWEGNKGIDIAPSKDGPKETLYRERISFEPLGPVENGPQVLWGLKYNTTAWPLACEDPFHEETGYWLWDRNAEQVMRCFIVPRGVVVNAGGSCAAHSAEFEMLAELGSETFGVLSSPFLDKAFQTVRYHLKVSIHSDSSFSYFEDTQLNIQSYKDIFHHTDKNMLAKTG